MYPLPMMGTNEKTATSHYQITLVDKTNKGQHPMDYPRINRFFEHLEERNTFIRLFETAIFQSGGNIIHNQKQSHPLFESFTIVDKEGNTDYTFTVYR